MWVVLVIVFALLGLGVAANAAWTIRQIVRGRRRSRDGDARRA